MDKRLLEVRGRDKLYRVWNNMKIRCYYKKANDYKYYGGRGITVCDEWVRDSEAFMIWAIENGWTSNSVIDREDNDGDYSPSNCRFVTVSESNTHKRSVHNSTGYIGVSKNGLQYRSQIKINGVKKFLGLFASPRMAALRYDAEAFIINDGRPTNFN